MKAILQTFGERRQQRAMSCSKNENIMFMHGCVDVKTQAHNFVAAKIDRSTTYCDVDYIQSEEHETEESCRAHHTHTFLA